MADAPVWDVSYYRHLSTSSASLYHILGNHMSENPVAFVTRDTAYAVPYQTGHGGTITGAMIRMNIPASQTVMRMAFYARTGSFDAYPRQLIADLGSVFCASAFTAFSFTAIVTTPHDLWWLAYTVNSNLSTFTHEHVAFTPVFGRNRTDLDGAPAFLSYDQPYTSCWVATFPASAMPDAGGVTAVPQIGLRYGDFST